MPQMCQYMRYTEYTRVLTVAKTKLLMLAFAQKKMQRTPHTALMKLITVSHGGLPSAEPSVKPMTMALAAMKIITAHMSHSYHLSSPKLLLIFLIPIPSIFLFPPCLSSFL